METPGSLVLIAIGVVILIGLWLIFYIIPVGAWFSAHVMGLRISLLRVVLMRWRRIPADLIINSMIAAQKADLDIKLQDLESLYLAGGDVRNVVNGMIKAKKAGLSLSFKNASKADLDGFDLQKLVDEKEKENR